MDKIETLQPEQVLSAAVDTVTEKTFSFDITILPRGKFHAYLQRIGLARKKASYQLRPVSIGTLYRISKMILSIKLDSGTELTKLAQSHIRVQENAETIIEICATAIHNQKTDPPESLKSLIRDNLSAIELMKLMAMVVSTMAIENFIVSIVLVKGMNVLGSPSASVTNAE